MSDTEAFDAVRRGVGIADLAHVAVVRLVGDDAFALADAVSPRPLFVRNAHMLHTLFLTDDGHPLADCYVVAQDGDYLVLADGLSGPELCAWLDAHRPAGNTAQILDLGPTHRLLSVQGAYAWELIAEVVGPEVVGVPYLSTFRLAEPEALCLRAGTSGEFGYHLLVAIEHAPALEARVRDLGRDFDLVDLSLEVLDRCALESGFFCIRTPGVRALTPLQLQLGWRLAWDRPAPGMEALRAARGAWDDRITWFILDPGERRPEDGAPLALGGRVRGRVLTAWSSPLIDRVVGVALLDSEIAWPHQRLDAPRGTTAAPPLLDNRSLHLDPQRHSFAGRDVDVFPRLWGGP
jgi:aminomethyltransferase